MNGGEGEIAEELVLFGTHTQKVIGLLNDDCNEVGSVHLGVVHLFELSSDQISSNEDAIADLKFSTADELIAMNDVFETWSQICLKHLLALAV